MPGRLYLCIQTITKVESRYICISFAHVSYFTFWKFVIKMSLFYLLFLFCYLNAKNQFKVTKGCKKSDTLHWPFCSFILFFKILNRDSTKFSNRMIFLILKFQWLVDANPITEVLDALNFCASKLIPKFVIQTTFFKIKKKNYFD